MCKSVFFSRHGMSDIKASDIYTYRIQLLQLFRYDAF